MVFRRAVMDDTEQLITLRCFQLQDEGQKPDVNIEHEFCRYFKEKMESWELVEWIAEDDDRRIIATAAVAFMDFPPTFTNPSGKKGYITNMYTADKYRGHGIAGSLLRKLEQEARERGVSNLVLHASEMGRKAYLKSGYSERPVVMEKKI